MQPTLATCKTRKWKAGYAVRKNNKSTVLEKIPQKYVHEQNNYDSLSPLLSQPLPGWAESGQQIQNFYE